MFIAVLFFFTSCETTTSVEIYIDDGKYIKEKIINDTLIKYWSDKDYFTIYYDGVVIGTIDSKDSLKRNHSYYLDMINNKEYVKHQGKKFFKYKCVTCHQFESRDTSNILKTIHSNLIKEYEYNRNILDTNLMNTLLQGDRPIIYKKYYYSHNLNYHINYWMSGSIGKISLESYLNADERTLSKEVVY